MNIIRVRIPFPFEFKFFQSYFCLYSSFRHKESDRFKKFAFLQEWKTAVDVAEGPLKEQLRTIQAHRSAAAAAATTAAAAAFKDAAAAAADAAAAAVSSINLVFLFYIYPMQNSALLLLCLPPSCISIS